MAALGKQDAGRSAAQSCVERVVAAGLAALVLWAAEPALACSATDSVRQAEQNSLLELREYGRQEEPSEPELEER